MKINSNNEVENPDVLTLFLIESLQSHLVRYEKVLPGKALTRALKSFEITPQEYWKLCQVGEEYKEKYNGNA